MSSWINETFYSGKPDLKWIDFYIKGDGTFVAGHFRTEANETIADNLNTDVDKDGIPGFFDADADDDGIYESIDLDGDGMADGLEGLFDLLG
ncbi:hypothetical protein [Prochlorococcus sp. MIT 0916]|uniref:hypothetical protein n=1 Tax=Prochlorococcus sp. MIT 0916 TaxID=3082521 RepID=UPI0039B4A93C